MPESEDNEISSTEESLEDSRGAYNATEKAETKTQSEPRPIEEIKRVSRRPRSSRMDNQHGSAKMKVYPITEASIRSLRANSKNAEKHKALSSSCLSVAISIIICYVFTSNPTSIMKALAYIAPILCVISATTYFITARDLSKTVGDEWEKIESTTKFVDIDADKRE